jgi:hypothetical protein
VAQQSTITSPASFYSPFVYTGSGSSSDNGNQGIKQAPGRNRYVITGTSGNISSDGQGAVYVGRIDGASTSQGKGSGTWVLMDVPESWDASSSSIYGPGAIDAGVGPGGISSIQLAGTYSQPISVDGQDAYKTLGFVYSGPLTSSPKDRAFTPFTAIRPDGGATYDTFLHSWSGRLVAGNYTLTNSFLALTLNTGLDSSAFLYDTVTGQQHNLTYQDTSTSHTAFGIWDNGKQDWSDNKKTYTIAGGRSVIDPAVKKLGFMGEALGAATLVDYDPVTGETFNQRSYQYNNDTSNIYVTHFEGIYYAGKGIYQMPFTASSSAGDFAGTAYVKRRENGRFSRNALWSTLDAGNQGEIFSNDSCAGRGSTGLLSPGSSTGDVVPFASVLNASSYRDLIASAQDLR